MSLSEDLDDRFVTAATPTQLPALSVSAMRYLTDRARVFAGDIARQCEPGRERALALTALEEALFWANKSFVVAERRRIREAAAAAAEAAGEVHTTTAQMGLEFGEPELKFEETPSPDGD